MSGPLIDLNGRVRDRRREQRARRVRLITRVVIGLTVVAVLGWIATVSPLFAVRRVAVSGNKAVTTESITQAAAVPVGQPLAQVDGPAITQRLAALPGLARSEVSVALPDTVNIKVTERTVVFVVAANGGFSWVDAGGQVFSQSKDRPAGVALAQVKDLGDRALLADVGSVVGVLPPRLAARLKLVTADTRDSIVLQTNEGTQVVWGSAEQAGIKAQLADTLTQSQPKCKVVDVSSPTQPTTRC